MITFEEMKKSALLLACLLGLVVRAQDMGNDTVPKNKKGHEILPKKGDYAIGFNTIPILNFFYESFTAAPGSGPGQMVQYTGYANNQITAKYFLKAKMAIRVRFGINTLGGTITNPVQDSKALFNASLGTPDDIAKASNMRVDDQLKFTKNNILLTVGIEKRRGYRRLQGYYGGEIGIGNTGYRESIAYGNAFSDQYNVVFTDNFNTLHTTTISPTSNGMTARTVENKHNGGIRLGVRGFVGIEYFIFAKISLAVEYGWGYSIATQRAAKIKQEVYNNGQNGPEVFKQDLNVNSREVLRGFSVDNNNGSLFSMNNTVGGNTALSGGAGALTLLFHF